MSYCPWCGSKMRKLKEGTEAPGHRLTLWQCSECEMKWVEDYSEYDQASKFEQAEE